MESQLSLFHILKDDAIKMLHSVVPANLESSVVATRLGKVSFHSSPKEGQCQRMFKLLHDCTHLTRQQSNAQNSLLVHARFCLCPPGVEPLFPPVLWKSCNQIPLMWGLEPSQQWETIFGIIVLQFVGHPPSGFGIWFYCDYAPSPISLKLLLCLWTWVSFFGRFLHSPVTVCSTASCDFGALTGRDEHTSFYSTILNQNSSLLHILRLAFNNLLISTVSAPPGDPCRTLTSCTQTQSLTLSPFPHQGPVSAETCPLFHSGLIWSQVKCTKALIGCSSQVSCL